MYQIALKRLDHYQVLNPGTIYLDKDTTTKVLENVSGNTIMGEGEYVLLEYSPFKVYRLENGKLINVTSKKEKV